MQGDWIACAWCRQAVPATHTVQTPWGWMHPACADEQARLAQEREQAERQAQQRAAEAERQAAENAWRERHQQAVAEAEREREAQHRARVEQLNGRFGEANAERIMRGSIWQGQTREMLIEARGRPADIDEHVLKTKTKATLKYNHQGRNRYGLRVFLENDVVVGWEDKG